MSKFTKLYIFIVCIIFLLCIIISHPFNTKETEIAEIELGETSADDIISNHLDLLSHACPVDINNGAGELTKAYRQDDKIIYEINLTAQINVVSFIEQLINKQRGMILYLYVIYGGEQDEYLNAFLGLHLSQVYKIHLLNGHEEEIIIRTEEIEAVRDFAKEHRSEALNEFINIQVSLFDSYYCPIEIAPKIVLDSIYFKDNQLIVYQVRTDHVTFCYSKKAYVQQKETFFNDLKKNNLPILVTCKTAEIGIQYKMIDTFDSSELEFDFSYDFLINDPFVQQLDLSRVQVQI